MPHPEGQEAMARKEAKQKKARGGGQTHQSDVHCAEIDA